SPDRPAAWRHRLGREQCRGRLGLPREAAAWRRSGFLRRGGRVVSKVVFCEDDPMIRKLVQTAMRSTTHDVLIAEDGKQGLDLIGRIRPDVVFSDVAMPVMDGFELADAMRARPELAHIPIVFMTASVQRDQIEECFRHGAAGHLAKPFTMSELRTRVAQFFKS